MAGLFFPSEARANVLNLIAGAGGANLWVHLLSALPTLADTLTLASLSVADFGGYSPYNSGAWSAPAVDVNGDEFIQSPALVFAADGTLPHQYVFAYALTMGALPGGKLLAVEALVAPAQMASAFSRVNVWPIKLSARNLAA
jgi:hypothetical protein